MLSLILSNVVLSRLQLWFVTAIAIWKKKALTGAEAHGTSITEFQSIVTCKILTCNESQVQLGLMPAAFSFVLLLTTVMS